MLISGPPAIVHLSTRISRVVVSSEYCLGDLEMTVIRFVYQLLRCLGHIFTIYVLALPFVANIFLLPAKTEAWPHLWHKAGQQPINFQCTYFRTSLPKPSQRLLHNTSHVHHFSSPIRCTKGLTSRTAGSASTVHTEVSYRAPIKTTMYTHANSPRTLSNVKIRAPATSRISARNFDNLCACQSSCTTMQVGRLRSQEWKANHSLRRADM
jgi:hypothetical protein